MGVEDQGSLCESVGARREIIEKLLQRSRFFPILCVIQCGGARGGVGSAAFHCPWPSSSSRIGEPEWSGSYETRAWQRSGWANERDPCLLRERGAIDLYKRSCRAAVCLALASLLSFSNSAIGASAMNPAFPTAPPAPQLNPRTARERPNSTTTTAATQKWR